MNNRLMESGPSDLSSAPSGDPLVRTRLLDQLGTSAEPVAILAAPSGYGKSVLARQIASCVAFDSVVWLDLPDEDVTDRLLVSMFLAETEGNPATSASGPWALRRYAEVDHEVLLAERLHAMRHQRSALVLDNIRLDGDKSAIQGMITAFLHAAAEGSRVILTTRSQPESVILRQPAIHLGADELRLSRDEGLELLRTLAEPQSNSAQADQLLQLSAGHLASFLVLCRYAALRGMEAVVDGRLPPSLQSRLRMVAASQLGPADLEVLFGCILLERGRGPELRRLVGDRPGLASVVEAMPLVTCQHETRASFEFSCHDLATASFCSREWAELNVPTWRRLVSSACELLEDRGDLGRLVDLVAEFEQDELVAVLGKHGQALLDRGLVGVAARAVAQLPMSALLASPRVLVLDANIRLVSGDLPEAERRASVARELARHSRDKAAEIDALTLVDAVCYGRGDIHASQDTLETVIRVGGSGLSPQAELLVRSSLAMGHAFVGDMCLLDQESERLEQLLARTEPNDYARLRAELRLASVAGGIRGNMRGAISLLSAVLARADLPVSVRLEAKQNLAAALMELGRLERVDVLLRECRNAAVEYGLHALEMSLDSIEASALAARGELGAAVVKSEACLEKLTAAQDLINSNYQRIGHAQLLAASGAVQAALAYAEEAFEYFAARQIVVFTQEVALTVAMCLAALGDGQSARTQAQGVRAALGLGSHLLHELLADLVLAEADRLEDDHASAVERLSAQRAYILSENANWTEAMFVRILPGLLGLMAAAVAPDRLPLHMLRMVGDEKLTEGLALTEEWMDAGALTELRRHVGRVLLKAEPSRAPSYDGCYVRMFGGLDVRTPQVGTVADSDWKKRKGRMLFAMLVARRGQDVPRDVLFEYLWPDMDEERARNNYYVVLSSIKRALCGPGTKGRLPYIMVNGAMCSIDTSNLRSDLDDFEDALARARAAESAGDVPAAVGAYHELVGIYRGDLLPGDLYDDWFAPLRERYRQEFSDAMLRGALLMEERGDIPGALHLVRSALAFDPWREDLHQAAMRFQIGTGQRSAAVETYVACKTRLAEDLGLDPSAETRRLYETILAMEDDAEPEVA